MARATGRARREGKPYEDASQPIDRSRARRVGPGAGVGSRGARRRRPCFGPPSVEDGRAGRRDRAGEAGARARALAGAYRRVRAGRRHPLHTRKRREALRAVQAGRTRAADRDFTNRLQVPGARAARGPAAGLRARRARARDAGRGRGRRLQTPPRRAGGGREPTARDPLAPRPRTLEGGARGITADRER